MVVTEEWQAAITPVREQLLSDICQMHVHLPGWKVPRGVVVLAKED